MEVQTMGADSLMTYEDYEKMVLYRAAEILRGRGVDLNGNQISAAVAAYEEAKRDKTIPLPQV